MTREGDVVSSYRLVRKIGEGGMGAVYEAAHTRIKNKRAAVKVLHPQYKKHAEAIARFEREAEATASIEHEGIVDIYDLGVSSDGSPFMVMEFLEGWPLSVEMGLGSRTRPVKQLGQELAVFIACNVLSSLSAAHQVGIIHRDLKPDNIFLISTGSDLPRIKLVDFGIARIVELGGGTSDFTLTKTGSIMGTPYYMSPEQALGFKDQVGQQTDLWSLGVILYAASTGRYPFDGENYNQLVAQLVSGYTPAEPSVLQPEIDPALEQVILKSMCKELDQRYASADEMLDDLRPLASEATLSMLRMFERGSAEPSEHDMTIQMEANTQQELPGTELTPGPRSLETTTTPSIITGGVGVSRSGRRLWPLLLGLGLFVALGIVGGLAAVTLSMSGAIDEPAAPATRPPAPPIPSPAPTASKTPPSAAPTPVPETPSPPPTETQPSSVAEVEEGVSIMDAGTGAAQPSDGGAGDAADSAAPDAPQDLTFSEEEAALPSPAPAPSPRRAPTKRPAPRRWQPTPRPARPPPPTPRPVPRPYGTKL